MDNLILIKELVSFCVHLIFIFDPRVFILLPQMKKRKPRFFFFWSELTGIFSLTVEYLRKTDQLLSLPLLFAMRCRRKNLKARVLVDPRKILHRD